MTNEKIKEIAKRYAAVLVNNSLAAGAGSMYLTEEEHEVFQGYVKQIAQKLAASTKMGLRCLEYGDLDNIILAL